MITGCYSKKQVRCQPLPSSAYAPNVHFLAKCPMGMYQNGTAALAVPKWDTRAQPAVPIQDTPQSWTPVPRPVQNLDTTACLLAHSVVTRPCPPTGCPKARHGCPETGHAGRIRTTTDARRRTSDPSPIPPDGVCERLDGSPPHPLPPLPQSPFSKKPLARPSGLSRSLPVRPFSLFATKRWTVRPARAMLGAW